MVSMVACRSPKPFVRVRILLPLPLSNQSSSATFFHGIIFIGVIKMTNLTKENRETLDLMANATAKMPTMTYKTAMCAI